MWVGQTRKRVHPLSESSTRPGGISRPAYDEANSNSKTLHCAIAMLTSKIILSNSDASLCASQVSRISILCYKHAGTDTWKGA